jgi:hypothetical protein
MQRKRFTEEQIAFAMRQPVGAIIMGATASVGCQEPHGCPSDAKEDFQ